MREESIKTTKGGVVHPRVSKAIERLGADISHARRVRRIGAEDFANRIGVSRATLHRLEAGDAGVSLNTLAMALQALGRLESLATLAIPENDHVTMMQMRDQAPRRISKPRQPAMNDVQVDDDAYEPPAPAPGNKFRGF